MLKRKIAIIFPPMIGDSIMAMPLVYEINNCGDTPYVFTSDYNFDVISNLVIPIQVNTLTNSERYSFDIIIDFLSNDESANFILNHQNAIKIGFPDGEMNYDINLKLPFNFVDDIATEIFLQALYLINTNEASKQKYQPKYKWKFNHQEMILIAPGAGNLKRCYKLDDFISLADLLIQSGYNVMFILGPLERSLENLIKKYRYIVTNNMNQTLDILQKSKIVISSEGGFMHICGFLGVPLVGLFRIAKIKNWFPYQLPYQMATGHETNEYQNITEKKLDINLVIKKINEINRILDGLSYLTMNDKAYIFTGTFEQFKGATIVFKRIRDLGSTLPIYFYTNELIIDKHYLSRAKIYNCVIINVKGNFNCVFSYKIQSILDSINKEVIFCDCDILPIQNLEILFDSTLYKSKGYVLFQDAQVSVYEDGTPQTDSGVMLWNKSVWGEKLLECLEFTEKYHDSLSMGDKESYYHIIKDIIHMPKIPDFIGFKEEDEFFGCSMLHYYDNQPIFIHSTLMKFNFNIELSPIWSHIFKNETNMLIHKKCKLYNRFFINNPTDERVNKDIFKLNEYLITDNN